MALVSLATLMGTAAVLAVVMGLAWLSFGRRRFAILWAVASVGTVFQWTLTAIGGHYYPGTQLPHIGSAALVIIDTTLIALACRDFSSRPLRVMEFAAAALVAIGLVIVISPDHALRAFIANGYCAAMFAIAAAAVLPRQRRVRAPELAALSVYLVFALFQLGLAALSLRIGPDGQAPAGDTLRTIAIVGLPGLYAAVAIAGVFLLATDLNAKLEALVTRDGLTGTLNRRGLDQAATSAIANARRHGRPLSVAVADLEPLGEINDRLGHAAVDRALVQFADCVQACVREEDLFGRLGGSEFCILLIDANEREANEIIERARSEAANITAHGPPDFAISASFGVAQFASEDLAFGAVLQRACNALELSKQSLTDRALVLSS